MKTKFLSLFLSLLLLLSLISGCGVTLDVKDGKPDVSLDLENLDSKVDIQLGQNGPGFSIDLKDFLPQEAAEIAENLQGIPGYSGDYYIAINGNVPFFTPEEITAHSFELYEELDHLGRCGPAFASIGRDLMPTEKRESIREVRPSGWHSVQYDWVDGKSLYNRCHLIGFQLAGENANEKNLITGTRSLNIHGMLPFENMIADYVKETGNHVMYRVTPVFEGNNLVADGVLMEGLSVEDGGKDISFCIFAYNTEPGVEIDYATGDNWPAQDKNAQAENSQMESADTYILNTGSKKFHLPSCPGAESISSQNKEVYEGTRQALIDDGYRPCGSCNP